MRTERITNVYNIRVLRKMTSHVNVDIFVKIMNCFIIFFWIFRTCESHVKRVSIWIFKIRMSIFDCIVLDSILIMIVMSNFFEFLINWINSYLIETNKDSCRVVHFSQSFVYWFQISAVFIRVFVVDQNVHIVCVFQKSRIDLEFIAHLQQIDIVEQIKNERQRRFLKSFCSHRERRDHSAIHRQNRRAILKKTDHTVDYSFRYSSFSQIVNQSLMWDRIECFVSKV